MRWIYRVCPVTGLKIDRQADLLIRAHGVAATVALLIGGIAAVLVLLTRWQAVHLLDAVWFYRVLTVHGMTMLIFFILFFEMAVLYFAGPVLLNCRVPAPRLGWAAFGLMVVGAVLAEWMMWTGRADVLLSSYVPLRAHPLYYLGIILFAVGALIVVLQFFASLVVAKRERTYEGSVPLITFGAATAAIIAVITLGHGAGIYIPTFLWSLGLMEVDPQIYRMVWWALGHSSQQINVAAMVSVWYLLGALTVGLGGAEREDQPHGLRAVRPVHLDGVRAPPAGRPGVRAGVEGGEHELLHVHGRAGEHAARLHRARGGGGRPAAARLHAGAVRLDPARAVG